MYQYGIYYKFKIIYSYFNATYYTFNIL